MLVVQQLDSMKDWIRLVLIVNRYACHGVVTLLYLYIDYYDLYVGIFCSLNDLNL